VKFGREVFELCGRTDRHTQYTVHVAILGSPAAWERSNNRINLRWRRELFSSQHTLNISAHTVSYRIISYGLMRLLSRLQ